MNREQEIVATAGTTQDEGSAKSLVRQTTNRSASSRAGKFQAMRSRFQTASLKTPMDDSKRGGKMYNGTLIND